MIKVFTIYHSPEPPHEPRGPFEPLSVYCDDGDNIADREAYGEMRAHYFAWRNNLTAGLTHIGFQHYRRWLDFDCRDASLVATADAALFALHVKSRPLPSWVEKVDVVTAARWFFKATIGDQYSSSHRGGDWNAFCAEAPVLVEHALEEHSYHPCNIFVMRVCEFDRYMRFWWPLMQRIESRVERLPDGYQGRAMAFLSERIFSLWVDREAYSAAYEVPLIMDAGCALPPQL
jgi:hypothetical protein